MHSTTIHADPDENPTRFHFNQDLSGAVVITVPASAIETVPGTMSDAPGDDVVQVSVPGRNLEGFILQTLRDRLVDRLEGLTLDDMRDLFAHTR